MERQSEVSSEQENNVRGWIIGMQRSIEYMESHLEEKVDVEAVARAAGLSSFYFQRIFGALCGMSVGEYVRARRMTRAAQALVCGKEKVTDIALRFGYESPDSFSRAFYRFHGCTPSQARERGAKLRDMAPIHIKIVLEGGTMLDYRIVEKAPFTIVGFRRRFSMETCYQEIPKFWDEFLSQGADRPLKGIFGVCMDSDADGVDYWIADLYEPWRAIPPGCETRVIPGSLWAQFLCKGPLPDSLQSVNTRIWNEWLPSLEGYALAGNYNLEVYEPPAERPEDTVSYIWIPLVKK